MLGADFVHCADVLILALSKMNVTDYMEKVRISQSPEITCLIGKITLFITKQ
jgi:hypothetical protein